MITVEIIRCPQPSSAEDAELSKLVQAVCNRFEISRAVISVAIIGDAEISTLNREFLDHEGTTDCLSFDLSDEAAPGEPKVFELVVNGELAAREADRRGHSARAELALYIVHGLLHQLGFDDTTSTRAREMHRTEDEILQQFGYGLVYNSGLRAQ